MAPKGFQGVKLDIAGQKDKTVDFKSFNFLLKNDQINQIIGTYVPNC